MSAAYPARVVVGLLALVLGLACTNAMWLLAYRSWRRQADSWRRLANDWRHLYVERVYANHEPVPDFLLDLDD